MIIRRQINSNYSVLPNAVLRDRRLSIEARAVIAFLLTCVHDWQVDVEHLGNEFDIGRDRTRRIVRELIDAGYVLRQRKRSGGSFDGFEYLVFDDPAAARAAHPEAFEDADSPETENTSLVAPATDLPAPGNTALASIEKKYQQEKREREAGASAGAAGARPSTPDPRADDAFVAFMNAWPTGRTDDLDRAFAEWLRLSPDDRRAAREGVDPFRIANRNDGRTKVCAAATYLKQRSWERVGGAVAGGAGGGPVQMLKAFSRAWWFILHRRRARGENVRPMLNRAADGVGYACPSAELPTEADERALAQIAVDSDCCAAWREHLGASGLRLPDIKVPYVWMPSAWPGDKANGEAEGWRHAG